MATVVGSGGGMLLLYFFTWYCGTLPLLAWAGLCVAAAGDAFPGVEPQRDTEGAVLLSVECDIIHPALTSDYLHVRVLLVL